MMMVSEIAESPPTVFVDASRRHDDNGRPLGYWLVTRLGTLAIGSDLRPVTKQSIGVCQLTSQHSILGLTANCPAI